MPSFADNLWPSEMYNQVVMPFTDRSGALGMTMNDSPTSAADLRLINALRGRTAYIHGDPADGQDLELYYYRFVSPSEEGVLMVVWNYCYFVSILTLTR
jgi:hypothetical protein